MKELEVDILEIYFQKLEASGEHVPERIWLCIERLRSYLEEAAVNKEGISNSDLSRSIDL